MATTPSTATGAPQSIDPHYLTLSPGTSPGTLWVGYPMREIGSQKPRGPEESSGPRCIF